MGMQKIKSFSPERNYQENKQIAHRTELCFDTVQPITVKMHGEAQGSLLWASSQIWASSRVYEPGNNVEKKQWQNLRPQALPAVMTSSSHILHSVVYTNFHKCPIDSQMIFKNMSPMGDSLHLNSIPLQFPQPPQGLLTYKMQSFLLQKSP